jgi:GW (Gly-Tryp) dipeptide domain
MRTNRSVVLGFALVSVLGLAACKRHDAAEIQSATTADSSPAQSAAPAPSATFVTQTITLKREASEQAKVDDGKGKQVANWLATLYRGEKVTMAKDEKGAGGSDYVLVTTSNDLTGWIKSNAILSGSGVREAVSFEQIETFDRPDMLALNGKKKVPAGTLMFVTKEREPFSEVNVGGNQAVWVLSAKLVSEPNEIMVAKLFAKARAVKGNKNGNAEELVQLARSNFANARLVDVMELEFGVLPASAAFVEAMPPAEPESAALESKPVEEKAPESGT